MRVKINIAIFLLNLNPAGKSSDKFTMESIESMSKKVGTPAYLLDLNRVRQNVRMITDCVTYPNFQIHYAMFCNDNEELLKFLRKLGLGVLVLNENEFEIGSRLGFPKDKIHLTGGTFSKSRLEKILSYGIDVNLDSLRQLELVNELSTESNQSFKIGLRLKLFGADVAGAGEGISIQDVERAKKISAKSNIQIAGLQTYIGTNTLDEQKYLETIKILIDLRKRFPNVRYINIGGGFGIPYSSKDKTFDWKYFGKEASHLFKRIEDRNVQFKMEPGRSIVGDAGFFLTRVIEKRDNGTLVVDAPYTNFTRPFVYHTNHRVKCMGNNEERKRFVIRGCSINSKDYLSHNEFSGDPAELPAQTQEGDVLCFRDVGAYSPVMQMDFLHYDKAETTCIKD